MRWAVQSYFGGAGVNVSRLCAGSGFGLGFGAFLTSFLPLSLFPMDASVPQKSGLWKARELDAQVLRASEDAMEFTVPQEIGGRGGPQWAVNSGQWSVKARSCRHCSLLDYAPGMGNSLQIGRGSRCGRVSRF